MSDAAREVYDTEIKINKAKTKFEALCEVEKKPVNLIRIALYGFFKDGKSWSVDEITSKMNQQSNTIYHVSTDIVQAYINYMVLNEILMITYKNKYGLINNIRAI